ncbi:MAG: tetratricopeptide repeat protein [Bacteroidota bacterium]
MKLRAFLFLLTAFLLVTCAPKVVEEVVETPPPPPPKVRDDLSPCGKFYESSNPDEAETAHVLYRDLVKMKKFDEAMPLWEKAIKMAPAADGLRDYHFMDGVKIYKYMYGKEEDVAKKSAYIDKIFELYDEAAKCYPKKAAQYKGLKGFNLYFNYKDKASKEEIYQIFKEVADSEGNEMPYFIINPFTATLVDLTLEEKIPTEEAFKYQSLIKETIAKGVEDCEGKGCDSWKIIESYAPVRLEDLETIKGFYDCAYYNERYYVDFEESPQDCDVITTVFSRLKWGGCGDDDAALAALNEAYNKNCVVASQPSTAKLGSQALRDGNYQKAIDYYEQLIEEETDTDKKATYTLRIAKVYYVHLKRFSKAREYALKAAELKPDWGEPYLVIGRLYASSGPLCGPGTGFDSQIVVWVALDMWNKAKSIDPAAAPEANKFIRRYAQYMPNKEDIFIRGLKEGSTFRVPCWIQRNTVVRAAK